MAAAKLGTRNVSTRLHRDEDDGGEQQHGTREEDRRCGPAHTWSFDEHRHSRRQGEDQEHLPRYVDSAARGGPRLGDEPDGEQQCERHHGGVDPEQGPPVEDSEEGAPGDRTCGHAEAEHGAPHADRLRAFARIRHRVDHDRERHRGQHRSTHTLDGTHRDQHTE
jgi:hypothetical protein